MRVINNFMDPAFIEDVVRENKELIYENVWRSNLGWQSEIVSSCGVVLIRNLSEEQKIILRNALVQQGIIDKTTNIELDAQAYLWHKFSFIPWHSDKMEDDQIRYAATLYLNNQWNDDWGGFFMYKKNDVIYAEPPSYNKLVFNDNNFPHATTMLSADAPYRLTIQLFWKIIS